MIALTDALFNSGKLHATRGSWLIETVSDDINLTRLPLSLVI